MNTKFAAALTALALTATLALPGEAQAGRGWGWGPGFFAEVFFRPMQRLDPEGGQMRDVMRRLRRFYDRAGVATNPAVQEFQAWVAFLESWAGSLVGGAVEALSWQLFGLDFSFVRAASTAGVHGSGAPAASMLSPAHARG